MFHLLATDNGRSGGRPRYAKPRLETLEDRTVLDTYRWVGGADGLWSVAANWFPNTAPPGRNDTALFNNLNNNSCVMDVANPLNQRTVGELKVDGYTGTIKLRTLLSIDVLTMSSGKITLGPNLFGGNPRVSVRQDGNSVLRTASSWTGGEFNNVSLTLTGFDDTPLTCNIGHATRTPTLSGNAVELFISTDATINWNEGNISLVPDGRVGVQIANDGVFFARSRGKISAPAGKTWHFINRGELILRGEKQFENNLLRKRPGGTIYKQAALDGTPGTFTVIGEVVQEGGLLDITSGTVAVVGTVSQSAGDVTLSEGTSLTVTGAYTMSGGSVTETAYGTSISVGSLTQTGGTFTVTGGAALVSTSSVTVSGGTFVLSSDNSTVDAAIDFVVEAGGTLNAFGEVTVDAGALVNAGTINLGGVGFAGSLRVVGNYTQTGTLNVEIGGATYPAYDRLAVSGLATLGGTLNVTFLGGFMASPGQNFTVVTYGSRSGSFASVILPTLSFGRWDPVYDDTIGAYTLRVLYY